MPLTKQKQPKKKQVKMKKLIETLAALVVAFVLMGSVVGCGQAAPDQGEVDTTDTADEDMKQMEEDDPTGKKGQNGGGDGGGGDDPDGAGDDTGGDGNP